MKVLYFGGGIQEEELQQMFNRLAEDSTYNGIFIHSTGGNPIHGLDMAETLEYFGYNTYAGRVSSAAVLLYLGGERRYATRNSTFFFHNVFLAAGEFQGYTLKRLAAYYNEHREELEQDKERLELVLILFHRIKYVEDLYVKYVVRRTRLSQKMVRTLMERNVTLGPRLAMIMGIVHEVIPDHLLKNVTLVVDTNDHPTPKKEDPDSSDDAAPTEETSK